MSTDAALVLFPKFTSLVSNEAELTSFTSAPLDVSRFGSAQFQLWRGGMQGAGATFKAYLEESLDGDTWTTPPGGSGGFDPGQNGSKLFSYSFRLRWFRMRIDFTGECVSCWAEGVLR